jgi:hypothetical protein
MNKNTWISLFCLVMLTLAWMYTNWTPELTDKIFGLASVGLYGTLFLASKMEGNK